MDNVSHANICGIKINNCSLNETVEEITKLIKDNQHQFVVTCNVDHVIKLMQDAEFMKIYRMASLAVADGVPLLWASKFLGTPLKERVNGTDLFEELCNVAAKQNYRLFFLGGRPGAAIGTAEVLKKRYPNIRIVGTYGPPLGFENNEEENRKIVKMIRNSTPDLLFVGLGAPKQEKWIYRHKNAYRVPVSIGIGVSLELIAGMVKRAPLWMQRIGLEWFWRFMMEPGRLWKRYFIDDPKFVWLVLKQKMKID